MNINVISDNQEYSEVKLHQPTMLTGKAKKSLTCLAATNLATVGAILYKATFILQMFF